MKRKKTAIAIDFDGVIANGDEMVDGARLGLATLVDKGFYVIIHSARAKTISGLSYVAQWMDERDLMYHKITAIKPNAVLYVDDHALKFIAWNQVIVEVEAFMPKNE